MIIARIGVFFFSFLAFKFIYSSPIIVIFSQNLILFSNFQFFFLICFSLIIIISFLYIFSWFFCFPFCARLKWDWWTNPHLGSQSIYDMGFEFPTLDSSLYRDPMKLTSLPNYLTSSLPINLHLTNATDDK